MVTGLVIGFGVCFLGILMFLTYQFLEIKKEMLNNSAREYQKNVESIKTPRIERPNEEKQVRNISSRKGKIEMPIGLRNKIQDELIPIDQAPIDDFFASFDDNGRLAGR